MNLRRPRALLAVLPLACAGALTAAACSFPDISFGGEDGSADVATDGSLRDEASAIIDGGADGAKPLDAGLDAPAIDAKKACPSICFDAGIGTCDSAGACLVTCTEADACSDQILCPAGIPCIVTCTGARSCASIIDCKAASTCNINCIGANSCKQQIECAGSKCKVACVAADTCAGAIKCTATSCDVRCQYPDSCKQPITCSGTQCLLDCSGARSCAGGVCCDAGSCLGSPTACK